MRAPGCLAAALALCLWGAASAQDKAGDRRNPNAEGLFLDMSRVNLGTIKTEDDKKKYLYTIQLEKARITRKTLRAVYENAYDLYRSGDFEGTRELTSRILQIDPAYEDAAILQRASTDLQGAGRPGLSERKLVENKFDEGIGLYRQGRLVEAAEKLEEAMKLSPSNLRARYWLKKVRAELADEHFRRGQLAYRQHRLRETLDQWYAALVLNPRYPRLMPAISKVETEVRQAEANEKLQTALQLYSQGKTDESLKSLDQVLQVEPGDPKAQRLMAEIRSEIANQHVSEGRKLYAGRRYTAAISKWKKATEYGYETRAANQLIARAKEQMRREEEARRRAAEEAQRREEEARKKAEEEAAQQAELERKKQEEAKQALVATQPAPGAAPTPTPGVVTDENRKNAITHWNAGIIFFQKGDYEKARDEWVLCKQLDPASSDCVTGLQRIEQQIGGP